MFQREIYRGVAVWNKSQKRDEVTLRRKQRCRPETEWRRIRLEHLQIISDDFSARVESRRKDTEGRTLRFGDGRISGRPPKYVTNNLLAGLASCGWCGGGLVVETSSRKHGRCS